jgi:hypothetical protein
LDIALQLGWDVYALDFILKNIDDVAPFQMFGRANLSASMALEVKNFIDSVRGSNHIAEIQEPMWSAC